MNVEPGLGREKVEAIFVVDHSLRIVQWSREAAALVGTSVHSALGHPCYEIVRGQDLLGRGTCGPRCPALEALGKGRTSGQYSLILQRKYAPPLRLRCELIPLPLLAGQAIARLYSGGRLATIDPGRRRPLDSSLLPDTIRDSSALLALTTALSSATSGSLELALDILRDTTTAEAAELFLTEPEGRGAVLSYFRGPFKHAFSQITRFRVGEGFPGIVVASRAPIVSTTLSDDPRYLRTLVKARGFHSYLCVPLHAVGGAIGSVNLAFRHSNADLDRALAILTWASAPLSMRLQADLLQAKELARTHDAQGDEPEVDFGGTLRGMLGRMMGLGGAQRGVISLLKPMGGGLAWHVGKGLDPSVMCPALKCDAPQLCPALAEAHGVALYGARKSWPLACQHGHRLGEVSYCIPIATGGGITGVLQLAYEDPAPEPPTRSIVALERAAETAARTIDDAWRHLEKGRHSSVSPGWLDTLPSSKDLPSLSRSDETLQDNDHTLEPPYLDIRCFGHFELHREGTLITPDMVRRRKILTLLKILVLNEGRYVSKDTLMELLWPEVEPEAGASRLYVLVHSLRRLVEPAEHAGQWLFIRNDGGRYYFDTQAACRIDLREFKALVSRGEKMEARSDVAAAISAYETAAQLYRGDLLEDEAFAEWCWMEREELREVRLEMAKRLAFLCAGIGRWEQQVRHLRHALRIDPLREELHRELIRGLWALGRRDEAFRQYEVCKDLLQRELGVRPLPETEQFVNQLRGSSR